MPAIRTGLDVLVANRFSVLQGHRVGLVTHPAAIDREYQHVIDRLSNAPGVVLAAIFGPEHGLFGQAQDLVAIANEESPRSTLTPVLYSLYGDDESSLHPSSDQLRGLDALLIDLQDIGSRYYTFQATMRYCLQAALSRGLLVVVVDRPNPLGGVAVEGPSLRPGFASFVGAHDVVIRHGMTIGELARLYRDELNLHTGELHVVPCEGWSRAQYFDVTGLPWVLPSPNMPTLDTALVYPGLCLLEGTNLSEGRGTTRPFELCGAPWLEARQLSQRLNAEQLPGVYFRPAWFRPTFHKFAGQDCGGIQLHVVDREAFQPVRTGLALLSIMRELSGQHFAWRTETYEFVRDPIAIDLLFGSDRERTLLEAGVAWQEIAVNWPTEESQFLERRRAALLYV